TSASRSAADPREPDASGQLDLFDPEPGDSEPPFERLDDERKRDRDGEEDRGDDRKDLEHIAREAFVLRDVADFALHPEHELQCARIEESDVLVRERMNDPAER